MGKIIYSSSLHSEKEISLVQKIVLMLAGHVRKDTSKYNINKIVTYRCKGYDLIGSSCNTRDSRRHFLLDKDIYDVYEIPSYKNNKEFPVTGDYLVLFKNIKHGFWIVAFMNHKFVVDGSLVREKVNYICEGEITVTETASGLTWECVCGEDDNDPSLTRCCRGFRSKYFDGDNNRKFAYKYNIQDIYEHFHIDLK